MEMIYLDDAIEAIASRDETDGTYNVFSGRQVTDILKGLPSAEQEIIRCRDCKYRRVNEHYGEKGYMNLKAICELDTGDVYQLGRNAEEDDWFCADAERRGEEEC